MKWIKCSERKPPDDRIVLCCDTGLKNSLRPFLAWYDEEDDGFFTFGSNECFRAVVSHWAEVPAIPEDEEELRPFWIKPSRMGKNRP